MTTYDNTNRGVLFDNDRKQSDSHPDMNGSLNIEGVEYWFSGWWKTGAKGEFLSLSIGKPKEQRQMQQAAPEPQQQQRRGNRPSNSTPAQKPPYAKSAPAGSGFDDMDDDIPF